MESVVPLTVRKALIIYISIVVVAIAAAWALAYWYDWQSGMILLTVVLIEHAWRIVKHIRQNKP